jgi:transposase
MSYGPARSSRRSEEPRIIGLLPREQHEAPQAARRRQETEEFRQQYAARAGIEGTHEQAARRCGLRRCRYSGQAKAHLHVLTAVALNVVRLDDWWAGAPVSRTRCSRFAALEQAA